jgi:hypothetical protein
MRGIHELLLHENQLLGSAHRTSKVSEITSDVVTLAPAQHNDAIVATACISVASSTISTAALKTNQGAFHLGGATGLLELFFIVNRVLVGVYVHECNHSIEILRNLSDIHLLLNLKNIIFLLSLLHILLIFKRSQGLSRR